MTATYNPFVTVYPVTGTEMAWAAEWLSNWLRGERARVHTAPYCERRTGGGWVIKMSLIDRRGNPDFWSWDAAPFVRALRRHLGVERLT